MTDSSNDARFVPSVYPSRRSLFTARISPIAAMKSIDGDTRDATLRHAALAVPWHRACLSTVDRFIRMTSLARRVSLYTHPYSIHGYERRRRACPFTHHHLPPPRADSIAEFGRD